MKFHSLNNPSFSVDFKQAVQMGQAPDKGLFYPAAIPVLSVGFLNNLKNYSKEEIAYTVIEPYMGNNISPRSLRNIIAETVSFEFPLVQIEDNIYTLELFHGPTLAFKDVGARFLSRCLSHFARESDRKITILVATSGDTGGAVADAFFNVKGVEVFILFPSKKVSRLQELQLTTYGSNITALEIKGTFDDCQSMVKTAFADNDLKEKFNFSSANSINIARWLSQQFYYFYALQQWPFEQTPVISVPSGNFGNICAGILAARSGLKIDTFIAACNENDVFTSYVETGIFKEKKAVSTISNAMDVGNPSNFRRVLEIFNKDYDELKQKVTSYSYTSEETRRAIKAVYQSKGYLLDPHGAVGYLALKEYLSTNKNKAGFFLETAHPAKFENVIEPLINKKIALPDQVRNIFGKEQRSILLNPDFAGFKEFLLSKKS